jgi:putative peptide zinc metalloprotease protein
MGRLSRIRTRSVVTAFVLVFTLVGAAPGGGLAQTATGPAAPPPTGASTAATQPAPAAPAPSVGAGILPDSAGGGPRNLVKVQNLQDGNLRVDGNVQLGRIPGPLAAPVNLAQAFSSCVSCQTLAVALQIDLITPDTVRATPENAAVAINFQCTDCDTIALAYQYVLTVDDPTQVPPEANQLVAQMRQQLVQMRGDQSLTLPDAEARVASVIAQFQGLAANLSAQRDESTAPTTPGAAPPGP